jgi:PAS domain S-box-containing protein
LKIEAPRVTPSFSSSVTLPANGSKEPPTDDRSAARLPDDCFRLLVEAVKDYAIILLDPQGLIVSWNCGAETIFGYESKQILQRPFTTFYTILEIADDKPNELLSTARATGRVEEEGWRRRQDGSHFWAHVVTTVVHETGGGFIGFGQVIHDLSEQKRAHQVLVEHRALERSNRELEQFAYVASHDLQEPLRKILAFGGRLKSKCGQAIGAEGTDYLERMLRSAERMQTLINDLLTFSRLTTKGKNFTEVNLYDLVNEVLGDLESRIEKSGAVIEVKELPVIDADPLQMRQLFQNLIGNAIKFTRAGVPPVVKIYSKLFTEPRFPAGQAAPQFCDLHVEDNGIGFDEKYLSRIFTVFQRLHGREEYEGTGIGLAVCRRIVEWHGGSITAHSQPQQGATFIVTLPIKQLKVEKK